MLNNRKMIKELEDKISELEEKIPNEYDIMNIADEAIKAEEAELRDVYELRRDEKEKVWNDIAFNIEGIVEQRLPALIEEATKVIQDKLLVELARKAMNMEDKK